MSDVMSMQITGLTEAMRGLDGKRVELGRDRGLKKVGKSVASLASSLIREQYNLKKADVDAKFDVIATDEAVLVICKSRPINLTAFGAKQYGTKGGKRLTVRRVGDGIKRTTRGKAGSFGGVSAPIVKSRTTLIPGAFIAQVKAGNKGGMNIGVFTRANHDARTQYKDQRIRRKTNRPYSLANRTKSPRKAIVNMAFVSVATLFGSNEHGPGKTVKAGIEEYLQNDALKTVLHEISFAMENDKP